MWSSSLQPGSNGSGSGVEPRVAQDGTIGVGAATRRGSARKSPSLREVAEPRWLETEVRGFRQPIDWSQRRLVVGVLIGSTRLTARSSTSWGTEGPGFESRQPDIDRHNDACT